MRKTILILLLAFLAVCSNAQTITYDTICNGNSRMFHGRYYYTAGSYPYSIKVIDHIDTIVPQFVYDTVYRDSVVEVLNLTVLHPTITSKQINSCVGNTVYYNNRPYTNTTTFNDTLKSIYGCDSIIRVVINFHPVYHNYVNASICNGDFYRFGTRRLTKAGVYTDTLHSVYGCDSVTTLTLTVNNPFYREIYDTICNGMSYLWMGKIYRSAGTYQHQTLTTKGCDSTHVLHLHVLPEIERHIYDSVCLGDSCLFYGRYYSVAGTYSHKVTNIFGCDTTYYLHLKTNNHVYINLNETICENSYYQLAGKRYNMPGVYYDTLPGSKGACDTFVVLTISTLPVSHITLKQSICAESSFYYRGRNITKTGIYNDTLIALNGCDSIITLIVNLNPSYTLKDTAYICEGDSITFFNRVITDKGTYTYYLSTIDSCDSVIVKTVIMHKRDTVTLNINRCDHQPYNFFGQLITQPGTYQKVLTNRFGCDSITILNYDTVSYFYVEKAHICEGESYDFHGKRITTAGTHYARFTSQYGCDSTYKLLLTVGKHYEFVTHATSCADQPYIWRGKPYTMSGSYYDSLSSTLGCDSVYILKLTILNRPEADRTINICNGDSLYFKGRLITRSVNIDDTLKAPQGCDSIIHYHFNLLPSFFISDTIGLCAGSSYKWHGKVISRGGVYWDSLKTNMGCDSIFQLTVLATYSRTIPLNAQICQGEYYNFNGRHIYTSGTYYDTIYNAQGCADFYVLNLTVNPTYLYNDFVTICSGQSFWYKGIFIDRAGIYYDTLTTAEGCDSVFKIVVNHAARYFFSDTVRIYKGATYNFHGRILSQSGTYYDSLQTVSGCDSIFQLILNVAPLFHKIEYATICDNEWYSFNGRLLNQTGIYYDSLKTYNNFDSIYELHLTANPTYLFSSEHTVCYGNSIHFRNMHITKPGIYYDSLYTLAGCDSVYRLVFNWSNTYLFEDTAYICQGDYHVFRGDTLTKPGVYYDSLLTHNGCDSIYRLLLVVKHHFYTEMTDTMCEGDVYNFHGRLLIEPGVYYDSIHTPLGCDSIYKLTLSKYPSYQFTTFIEECYGHRWIFRGRNITKPGVYYDSLYSSTGCDSIYKLVYSWSPDYHFYDTANICIGDTLDFRGRPVHLAGDYYDSLKTIKGCDSIYQLHLNVVKVFHDIKIVHICSNEYYNFRGTFINQSGIYYDSIKNPYGCDSVYELRLTILPEYLHTEYIEICNGASFQYKNRTITKPGTYYDSLLTQQGCDSVIKIIVNYNQTYLKVDTATMCAGSYYTWRGRNITVAGDHYDSLTTIRGCDSIFKLVLNVVQPFYDIQTVEICSNETYNFHGRPLSESGVYFDSLKGFFGCDSIYELRLRIKPHYVIDDYIETCYGNSIFFRGSHITKPGIYYDSLLTSEGCDSVYRLVFSWKSNYFFPDTAVICNGTTINFRGQTLSKPGYYYDSLKTVSGCDSIYQLVLIVNSSSFTTVDTTLCSDQTFTLRGRRITQSGVYHDTIRSIHGCDSFITYNVTIHPSYIHETHTTLCQGSDIFFRTIHITKPGVYYDTMKTIYGCDSIFKMTFNWTPTYLRVDTIRLCDGTTYNFHGRIISATGTYYDSLTTIAGCDSIHKLVVYAGNGFYREIDTTICSNQVFILHDRQITTSGVYWDSLSTINGCDSVYKYTVTINTAKTTTINVDICSNDLYYRSDGTTVNRTGIYVDSLFTSTGCDSIVRVVLNVHADQIFVENKTICKGNYYSWRGRRLTSSGVYWDSLVSSHGCDSIFRLNLTNNTYYTEIDTTLCDNTIFRFNNRNYTTTGIYYDTIPTILGCDSVFKIDLKINTSYNIVRHITMCDTDYPIPFGGTFVNQTGVYHDTTVTLQGCDSINTLYLTVVQTYFLTEDTICEDEVYSWHGHQYTQPGLYNDTVLDQTEAHCDIIYSLRLHTVQKTYLHSADVLPFICADDIEYTITPRYTGSKPDLYTIRYTSAEIGAQCDIVNAQFLASPITIPMPLTADGDSLRPDTYTGTIELFNHVCDANPQSYDFTLNIRYPSYIVNQHWNDVVAILNSRYNGGYTFSDYDWYVNDILIQSITGSNMYLPNLRTGDKVEVGLTREGETYAVLTCPIWIQDLSNMEVSEYPVAVEGTILRNTTHARIIASADGTYALHSATGITLTTGTFRADSETLVTLPSISGIYFLTVVSNNEPRTFKLVVQ